MVFNAISFDLVSDLFRADMHNMQSAGQMWAKEAFNMARKTLNFVYFACFFDKNTLWMC